MDFILGNPSCDPSKKHMYATLAADDEWWWWKNSMKMPRAAKQTWPVHFLKEIDESSISVMRSYDVRIHNILHNIQNEKETDNSNVVGLWLS